MCNTLQTSRQGRMIHSARVHVVRMRSYKVLTEIRLAFAGLLQALYEREFDVRIKSAVCLRKSATVKTFLEMLAGLPQTPKSTFPSLRDSRKRQKAVFPCCGTPASAKKQFFLVAGIPQSPKSTFSSLRKSRKRQKAVFPCCGIPASISENILAARVL